MKFCPDFVVWLMHAQGKIRFAPSSILAFGAGGAGVFFIEGFLISPTVFCWKCWHKDSLLQTWSWKDELQPFLHPEGRSYLRMGLHQRIRARNREEEAGSWWLHLCRWVHPCLITPGLCHFVSQNIPFLISKFGAVFYLLQEKAP